MSDRESLIQVVSSRFRNKGVNVAPDLCTNVCILSERLWKLERFYRLTDIRVVEEIESYLIPDIKKAAAFACGEAVKRSGFTRVATDIQKRCVAEPTRKVNTDATIGHFITAEKQYRDPSSMREVHWMCPCWVKLAHTKFNKQEYDLQIYSEGIVAIVIKPIGA